MRVKQSMRKKKATDTRFSIAGALAVGIVFATLDTTTGGAGYLARLGPVPLRFKALPVAAKNPFALPPLPAEKPLITPTNMPDVSAKSPFGTNDTAFTPFQEFSLWPGPIGAVATNSNSSRTGDAQSGNSELQQNFGAAPVPPQVFLDYFKPSGPFQSSTNASGYSVGVPVNFAFPVSPIPPSSHAIYRSE